MFRYLMLITSLALVATPAFGDADEGSYLGFKLGQKFEAPKRAVSQEHVMGALVYFVDPDDHPYHIDEISVYVSPESYVIGSIFGRWYFSNARRANVFADRYMARLQEKYSHWRRRGDSLTSGDFQLWVYVEEKPLIVDYWPSPLNVRVGIGLIYAPNTVGRTEWTSLILSELDDPLGLAATR